MLTPTVHEIERDLTTLEEKVRAAGIEITCWKCDDQGVVERSSGIDGLLGMCLVPCPVCQLDTVAPPGLLEALGSLELEATDLP